MNCELTKPSRLNVAKIELREKGQVAINCSRYQGTPFYFQPAPFHLSCILSHARVKESVEENSLEEMLSYIYIYIARL